MQGWIASCLYGFYYNFKLWREDRLPKVTTNNKRYFSLFAGIFLNAIALTHVVASYPIGILLTLLFPSSFRYAISKLGLLGIISFWMGRYQTRLADNFLVCGMFRL